MSALITDPLARLADLLTNGVVGAARPAPCGPVASGAHWLAVSDAAPAPAFPAISGALRETLRQTQTPLADPATLGALDWIGAQRKLPSHLALSLPYCAAEPMAWRFVTRTWRKRLQSKALMLHEERRQMLGLSARLDRGEIAQAIHAAFVLPGAAHLLRGILPEAVQLDVTQAPAPQGAAQSGFAPLVAQPGDRLSGNPFALAIRTGYFGPNKSALSAVFRLTPGRFGGALRRAGQAAPQDLRIALAVPQFHLFPTLLPCEVFHA